MKTIYVLLIISIFFSTIVYTQDTTYVYYDNDWMEISKKDEASYYRKAFIGENSLCMAYDYYIDGKIQMIGSFKSKKYKKQNGKATYFFENGQKSSEGNFYNGLKTGEWTSWYETGEESQKGRYEKGEKIGLWQGWYTNGNLKYSVNYEFGIRSGSWKYYYETGELKEKNTTTSNSSTFLCEGFFKDSSNQYIGTIQAGSKHGAWSYYNEDGRIYWEGHYKYGLKVLLWTRYFKEGKMEIDYKDGVIEGKKPGGVVRRN